MDDLIGRQAAIKEVGFYSCHSGDKLLFADNKLKQLPSVDAVEVVRCKDCKHSTEWYGDRRRCFLWCEDGISVFEDGFCNYGDRKDGEQNDIR